IALAQDALDTGQAHESLHDRAGVKGADEDVDVLDRLLPPAEAAANGHALDARHVLQPLEEHGCQGQRLIDAHALAHLGEGGKAVEDVLLSLGAETLELGDLARLTGHPELVETVDAELLVQGADLLRPEALDAKHVEEPGGRLGTQLVVVGKRVLGDELGDLLAQGLTDAAELAESPVGDEL